MTSGLEDGVANTFLKDATLPTVGESELSPSKSAEGIGGGRLSDNRLMDD